MIEKEALKLHSDLVIPDIAALEESKGKSKDKRENILIITGVYSHYKDVPEPELWKEQNWEHKDLMKLLKKKDDKPWIF